MANMEGYTAYFNGEWVDWSQVLISPDDRGFMLGDVVFDIARTFDGKPFRLDDHIDRLYRSLKFMDIDPGLSSGEMTSICEEAVERNLALLPEAGDFNINPFVTAGSWIRGEPRGASATVCVAIKPIGFSYFAPFFLKGAHGVIARTRSYDSNVMEPKVKHHSRGNFVLAELEARAVDPAAFPILLDTEGNVSEGIGYNVFIVRDGAILTAPDDVILQGISRKTVIEVAESLELPVIEERFQPYDVYNADEVFFTGTSPRIYPVAMVDFRPIGDGAPGPVTSRLLAAHSELVGVDIVDQALHYAGLKQ